MSSVMYRGMNVSCFPPTTQYRPQTDTARAAALSALLTSCVFRLASCVSRLASHISRSDSSLPTSTLRSTSYPLLVTLPAPHSSILPTRSQPIPIPPLPIRYHSLPHQSQTKVHSTLTSDNERTDTGSVDFNGSENEQFRAKVP